jgi:1-phosphofructokinase family hexose kinase
MAGGRGINAARVLVNFGVETVAVTTSGRETGRKMEELLQKDAFEKDVVKIRNTIRTNLTISDRQGLSIKLNEIGPSISKLEQKRISQAVERRLPEASWLMLCGSLPPDIDLHFYSKLLKLAAKHKVQTMLDTDGDPLLHAMEGGPTVVKPNQSEAERLLNTALITRTQLIDAVQKIKSLGAKSVVLSLGSRGVIAATFTEGIVEVIPPAIDAVCPIGAGDAMSAAIVWSLSKGNSFSDSLRWGVAAGTASSKLPGITMANLEQTKEIYPHTQITKVVV